MRHFWDILYVCKASQKLIPASGVIMYNTLHLYQGAIENYK